VSTTNAELVRSGFEAFLRGDWDALGRVLDPDVQWLWYEPGDWDCHDRRKVLATLFERQRQGVVTGLEDVVATDDRVFVEVTGGQGQGYMVVTMRDGRIVLMQGHRSRAAALFDAGLITEVPLEVEVTEAIRTGDAASLERLLGEHPELVTARFDGSRTLLHLVTDWPGHVPEAGAKIRALVAAGADPDGRFEGAHGETPLHWAASCDDLDALDALLDAGADIEAEGAVIGGGTPMADAVAFGQWKAARRLLERGARTSLWQSAALGLLDRTREQLAGASQEDLDNALWCAAHGGQRETAQLLLNEGADASWVGHDDLTAAQAAERSGHPDLAEWLRS